MLSVHVLRLAACVVSAGAAEAQRFLVGVGKADMTGPIAEVDMMGYAQPSQTAAGLHLRLFARAFVAADPAASDKRVCFVSMDSGMPSQAQKIALVRKLRAKWPDGRYNERNVMISGTHTHSGPSGFFQYALFDVAGSLHVNATAAAFVDGVFDAIVAADSDFGPASISVSKGEVEGGNINRSPSSYLYNPPEERARYAADTDTQIVQLHFTRPSGDSFALFNWFAVHPTSMNFTNHLISGDHKGKDGPGTGQPCDVNTSTCPMPGGAAPAATYCYSLGPGRDMFESTQIIARKQAQEASMLLSDAGGQTKLSGSVSFAHSFINMSSYELPNGERTCPPGLGFSFAGGTTDGPGDAPFHQGYAKSEIPELWVAVRDFLAEVLCSVPPTAEDYSCHEPKAVLLPTGLMDRPWMWHPDIVDVQLFRLGSFVIAGVPGEFTTMSGRRLRESLEAKLRQEGVSKPQVVVAGLTNLYTQYIATPEEYAAQRYEAASTIYGPNTLPAYITAFERLVPFLVNGSVAPPGPNPPDLIAEQWEGLETPGVDGLLPGKKMGDVLHEANASYFAGRGHHATVINVTFLGANPRQDLKRGQTFLEVQHQSSGGTWTTIANDASIATRLYWEKKTPVDSGASGTLASDDRGHSASAKPPASTQEVEPEWPRHIEAVVAVAERVTGRRLNRARVEACLHTTRKCTFKSASVNQSKPALGESANEQASGHSEIVVQWRPALQAVAAPGGELETGLYRVLYHGDAKEGLLGRIKSFTGISAPFRLVVVP